MDDYGSVELGVSDTTDGSGGGDARAMINMAMGDRAAMRLVGYYAQMPGWIDALQPDGSIKEDVNSGTRTGGRLSFRFEPTDNIAITPRIIYQDVVVDGFNREDAYNILGNPYTTTRAHCTVGRAPAVHAVRRAVL